jgi:PKD repeat protein
LLAFTSVCWLPAAGHAVTHDVSISGLRFVPNNLTIEVGDTVRWSNSGGTHDVTADDGSWGSVTSASWVYSRTFNSVEEVRYHCSVHSSPGANINTSMNGRISVVAATANQAPNADFAVSCDGLDCSFTDQSTDADGVIDVRSWDFGDGATSSARNHSHSYAAAGTYSVMLTVIDDYGASASRSRTVTVAESPAAFLVNAAITDAWFSPTTAGQGFFIIVWENIQTVFLSWFTYDTERPPQDVTAHLGEPGHRWLTAQGGYSGDTATLNVFQTVGGVFDSPLPEPDPALLVGTMTITWTGCNAGLLSYELPSLSLSGDIPIERIVLDNVPACEAAQPTP